MIRRNDVLEYLAEYLKVDEFHDYCVNGLQVEGTPEIERIAVGVSASQRLFMEAIAWGAQLLIVHHGLFWKGTRHPFALTGIMQQRVKLLLENDLNLAAYHLPLDAHPEIGNNAQLLEALGAVTVSSFDVGFVAEYEEGLEIEEVSVRLNTCLPNKPFHLDFGPERVFRIAVLSGGASTRVEQVAELGADAFVTGDLSESVTRSAEELGIHVFSAGHYNSERLGPMALGKHLAEHFEVPVKFFDISNRA